MATVLHYTKLAVAWVAAVTALVAVFLNPAYILPAAAISIAWSLLPES